MVLRVCSVFVLSRFLLFSKFGRLGLVYDLLPSQLFRNVYLQAHCRRPEEHLTSLSEFFLLAGHLGPIVPSRNLP